MLSRNLHRSGKGEYVLYWMQQAQRTQDNPALVLAMASALERQLPLVVCFGICTDYPGSNLRNMSFMLQSLQTVVDELKELGATVCVQIADPLELALRLSQRAALVVVDDGYLRHQRAWRKVLSRQLNATVIQCCTESPVPYDQITKKQEWSAATIRPKIKTQMVLVPCEHPQGEVKAQLHEWDEHTEPLDDLPGLLASLSLDASVAPVVGMQGGYCHALQHLHHFISNYLESYHELRNDPGEDRQSNLSPYLHFGQISSRDILHHLTESGAEGAGVDAFVEQLIIRRELAVNYVLHQPDYDKWEGLPEWCRRTLDEHSNDPREVSYTHEQLENAETNDPNWNAAMREMIHLGKMHGYMRMYWVKQLIAWCISPEQAYEWAIEWNDKYSLDGRDPNGYAGIGWCFGLHDRPWFKRSIFGSVRPMTQRGLEAKFNMPAYINRINAQMPSFMPCTTTDRDIATGGLYRESINSPLLD